MPRIILLETSTAVCSAALTDGEVIAASRRTDEPRAHASKTAVFVKEMLDELGIRACGCDAVAVSSGPGSYTGLRVGSSTAKGLCFGAGIPLISVSTPEILATMAEGEWAYVIPMIDARRMEVYCQIFKDGRAVSEIEAKIIDESSFRDQLSEGPCLFIGDGAEKCRKVLTSPNAHFMQCNPEAEAMAAPAIRAFNEKRFEDTAYFEPFYLKDFVATVSRKKLF